MFDFSGFPNMSAASCSLSGLFLTCALLSGCSSAPALRIERVSVPVPVVCQEPVPERPEMPTEHLPHDVSLDGFVAAAVAEIERREGYELRLRAALEACTEPH